MKSNYTHIIVIGDRSGSMQSVLTDSIGGFNSFLKDQKAVPGEATMSFYIFDDVIDQVHSFLPLGQVPDLTPETFKPRGMTALFDAVGRSIIKEGEALSKMPEDQRPEKVVCLIITDGDENSSREYVAQQIKDMITEQQNKYSWAFVFLGANINAATYAANMGIPVANSMTYAANSKGVSASYGAVSRGITRARCMADPGDADALKKSLAFTDEDRTEQRTAGIDVGP